MSRLSDGAEEVKSAADQVKGKASDVVQQVREAGTHIRDAATEKYGEVKEQATKYYNQGRQKAEDWEQGLETYIQEKPLQAVLLAAGVGLLLGLIWKRS